MPYCKRYKAIVHRDTCLDECEFGRGSKCAYTEQIQKKEKSYKMGNTQFCDEKCEYYKFIKKPAFKIPYCKLYEIALSHCDNHNFIISCDDCVTNNQKCRVESEASDDERQIFIPRKAG